MTGSEPSDFEGPSLQARLQRLARAALGHWRLESAQVSLLKHRENAVYQVTDPASVKAMQPGAV